MSTETINSEWLAQQLKTLLSSPYIHFSQPPAGLHGLRLGPGPIDLFSTRFENLFSNDATGVVAGEEVDRADLKQALLALQRTWNPDTLNISAPYTPDPEQIATEFAWTARGSETTVDFKAIATTIEEGGAPRINLLQLDGDQSLFVQTK